MCGVCGRFSVEVAPKSPNLWKHLVSSMARRGPDGGGIVADDHCVMGARRLAITDASTASDLPMTSPDGRHVLVFNGELYNFLQLRRSLESLGSTFRTAGDSEVVLEALRRWGTKAFGEFNGMFALAFYDKADRSILLARDHVGIKPLYVLTDTKGLVFASQYDQIMEHPWSSGRSVDVDALANYLRLGHIPAPRAYLSGTEMLVPGTWLRMDGAGALTRGRYFDIRDFTRGPRPTDEEIDHVIALAVQRQVSAEVTVGSLLSGGIDSPLLAAAAAQACGPGMETFAVASTNPNINEAVESARYAEAIGSRHHEVLLDESAGADILADVVDATSEPLADAGIFPFLLASRAAAEHVAVALSGEGGDELFWGYYPRQSCAIRDDRDNYGIYFQHFPPQHLEACFPGMLQWPASLPGPGVVGTGGGAGYERMRLYEIEQYLPFILLKADRASMHQSLELRVPFLDVEVMRLARRFHAADCIDPDAGLGKLPLRQALVRRVGFQTTKKQGFTAPINQWMRGWMRGEMSESLGRLGGLDAIDVDRTALARMVEEHRVGAIDAGIPLFRIFMLDRWIGKARASASGWATGEC
jgi:asparagine synthase (glutamine-hydrolysing)